MPSDPAKVEPSPREELLAEVRQALRSHDGLGYFTRCIRALEVLAETLVTQGDPGIGDMRAAREALRILRGDAR
jgi:hypothetical protein